MNGKIKRMIIYVAAVIILVFIDRATKIWAVNTLMGQSSIWLIPGVLQFYYLPNGNTGAAFGMLEGHQGLFLVIAVVVVVLIGYILYRLPSGSKYRFLSVMLLFIAAGGVGNMYDRALQGYVVDFIYFSLINFPIFNVADIYVSVCTVLLAIYLIFLLKEDDYKELEAALKIKTIKEQND